MRKVNLYAFHFFILHFIHWLAIAFSKVPTKVGTRNMLAFEKPQPGERIDILSDSSKISIGRRRTVWTPQVPMLIPRLFIVLTRLAESLVSKEMYVLQRLVTRSLVI